MKDRLNRIEADIQALKYSSCDHIINNNRCIYCGGEPTGGGMCSSGVDGLISSKIFVRAPKTKQSVVDEVVEKLESYERNSNKPPECVDLPFREILSDYRIEKKSKGVAMAGPKKKQSPRVELQNAIVSIFGVRNVEDMCKFDSLLSEYDITEKSSIVEPECEHEQHKDLCYPYSPTRPQPSKSVASGIDECASSIVDYFSEWDYEEEVKEILTKHWPQENK